MKRLAFDDPALERDFRVYQERQSAEIIRLGLLLVIASWAIGDAAVALFAPAHFLFTTAVIAGGVYPIFVTSAVLAHRAHTDAARARLQHFFVACDLATLGALIAIGEIALASTLMSLAMYIILIFDVGIATRRRTGTSVPVMASCAIVYETSLVWQHARGAIDGETLWMASLFIVVVLLHGIVLAGDGERMMRAAFLADRALADEKARSERLLRNVLPDPIAARLRDRPDTIADHHDEASVLFADLAGFTSMSSAMAPAEVVDLLNEVFTAFDELVERHGLEKIKTIGDCYMVAAGVPDPRSDHAQALVGLALEMRDLVAARTFAGHRLAFRFGIHSGPVVAGVIGRRKFIYDLWGDTVNVASRMESHGQAGALQITERTRALVHDLFTCESRGVVAIKGKGEMSVWHVVGRSG